MWITREDAVTMYAKFCRAHYGYNAYQRVRNRAEQLAKKGDLEGEKVWNEVATEIAKGPEIDKSLPA